MVLGPGKAQTAAEMMNGLLEAAPAAAPTLADVAAEKKQALKGKQTSAVQKFLAKFATIFTPLIPGFIAVGLLLGFATTAEQVFVLENAHPNASFGGADWLYEGLQQRDVHLSEYPDRL